MITVLFYCTARSGREDALRKLLVEMARISNQEDGAVNYIFMEEKKHPGEWALFEQWRDREHLLTHHASMIRHFGEPPPGAQVPARLHELIEGCRAVFYRKLDYAAGAANATPSGARSCNPSDSAGSGR